MREEADSIEKVILLLAEWRKKENFKTGFNNFYYKIDSLT